MVKIKNIALKNYCGYRNATFDFTCPNGEVKNLACFFGPNGCGKSTVLEAAELVSGAHRFYGKDTDLIFRKYTYHPDYNPAITEYEVEYARNHAETEEFKNKILDNLETMEIDCVFATDDGDKQVVLGTGGVIKNELPADRKSYVYYIDADHPVETQKFQLHEEEKDQFLDIAHVVYGYDCFLDNKFQDMQGRGEVFYQDFILVKPDGTRVHYRRMSAGERKIATLIRHLCNPIYMEYYDVILVDNAMMHVFYTRHIPMLDKLVTSFPDKQLMITTHSGTLINHIDKAFLYDVERIKTEGVRNEGLLDMPSQECHS